MEGYVLERARQEGYLVRRALAGEGTARWMEECWSHRIPFVEAVQGPRWARVVADLAPAGGTLSDRSRAEVLELVAPYLGTGANVSFYGDQRVRIDGLPPNAAGRLAKQLALFCRDLCCRA